MSSKQHIPVYSLQNFSSPGRIGQQYQVEVFDANRHFQVSYPHRHDFFEVLFLLEGSGVHVIDNNEYEIEPPCVFFLSPGQAHKLKLSHDIYGYIFIFTPDFYLINKSNQNRLIEFPFFYSIEQTNPPVHLTEEQDVEFLKQLFLKGIDESGKEESVSLELLRSILDLLLTFCASVYPVDDHLKNKGKGHLLVKKFYQLVEQYIKSNMGVADFADMLAVTPNHLTQTIRQLTGQTSNEIIKAKQLLEIKRLLVHSSLSVSEIAHHLNFPDQSYFTRFFKRETGMTPVAYRNASIK